MSLLLDALKKADQERAQLHSTPNLHQPIGSTPSIIERYGNALVIGASLILAITLSTALWLWFTSKQEPATISALTTQTTTVQKTNHTTTTPTSSVTTAEPNAEADLNAANPDEESVANLYQKSISNTEQSALPASDIALNETSTADSNTQAISITQFSNLPDIHDLPNNILTSIPSINYSEHNYNDQGGSVKINGEIKHTNETIANRIVIEKILEDGILLHKGNYAFKMKALNSWVNM